LSSIPNYYISYIFRFCLTALEISWFSVDKDVANLGLCRTHTYVIAVNRYFS